jgi:hypothetical protein
VAADEAQIARRRAEVLRREARDVGVARAVEAVAADGMLLGELTIDRVVARAVRERGVEGRVEDGDVHQLGQEAPRGDDAGEVRRVVQGCERDELADGGLELVVDAHRRAEACPAVHHAVPDRPRSQALRQRREQDLEPGLERGCVVGSEQLRRLAAVDAHRRAVGADSFDHQACEALARRGIEHRGLERRAAAVEYEDVHGALLCPAPRALQAERSQRHGFARAQAFGAPGPA